MPSSCPRRTESPGSNEEQICSKLIRYPLLVVIVTMFRSTTGPEKVTRPEVGAETLCSASRTKSSPLCPGPYRETGAENWYSTWKNGIGFAQVSGGRSSLLTRPTKVERIANNLNMTRGCQKALHSLTSDSLHWKNMSFGWYAYNTLNASVLSEFACSNQFDNSVLEIGAVKWNARDWADRSNHETEWILRCPKGGPIGHDHNASTTGRGSPLRSPDQALEPKDEAVHSYRPLRHLHHRPTAVG